MKTFVTHNTRPPYQYGGLGFAFELGWNSDRPHELGLAIGLSEYGYRFGLSVGRFRANVQRVWAVDA
jgi:hypothetical protein